MKTYATITIPGKPIPLKRPRLGYNRVYDAQVKLKEETALHILTQTDFPPLLEDIAIELRFFMKMPKGIGKKKTANLEGRPHTIRPDIDNLIKYYLDVCNGLLYNDDAQIYNIIATKIYCEEPRTEIIIRHGENNGIQE